jgi:hypothetical protein
VQVLHARHAPLFAAARAQDRQRHVLDLEAGAGDGRALGREVEAEDERVPDDP